MSLKPQDIVIALKLCGYPATRPPMAAMAIDLGVSPSEVHAGLLRLRKSRLIHGPELGSNPNLAALQEFLIHGLKYVFPAQHGEVTRGLPTSYAAPPLRSEMPLGDELPPVWPWPDGDTRGIALAPLYKTVPEAALRDAALYELLSLVDAIRDGRARDRKLAEGELVKRLRGSNVKS